MGVLSTLTWISESPAVFVVQVVPSSCMVTSRATYMQLPINQAVGAEKAPQSDLSDVDGFNLC